MLQMRRMETQEDLQDKDMSDDFRLGVKMKLSRIGPEDVWDAAYRAGISIRQGLLHQRGFREFVLREAERNDKLIDLDKAINQVVQENSYRGYI